MNHVLEQLGVLSLVHAACRSLLTSVMAVPSRLTPRVSMYTGLSGGVDVKSQPLCAEACSASLSEGVAQVASTALVGGAAFSGQGLPLILSCPPHACHCVTAVRPAAGTRINHTCCVGWCSVPMVATSDTAQGCANVLVTLSLTTGPGMETSSSMRSISESIRAVDTRHSSLPTCSPDIPCFAILLGKCMAPLLVVVRLWVVLFRPTAASNPGISCGLTPSIRMDVLFAHTRNDGKPLDVAVRSSVMMAGIAH